MIKITTRWILIILVFLNIATGMLKMDEVPPGISHDELEYINNGYSIFKTGRDLYGDFLPLSVGVVGYVAIPAYIAGATTALFGLSEWSARLFPAVSGIIEMFIIWLFIKAKKIRDFIVAWIVLFLGTLSYYGSLFVLPLLVLILIIFRWNYIKKYKKPFFLGSGIVLFIFGLILLFMLFHPGENSRSIGRSSEIIFFQEKNITDNVIYDRSTSVGPEIVD